MYLSSQKKISSVMNFWSNLTFANIFDRSEGYLFSLPRQFLIQLNVQALQGQQTQICR